MSLNLDQVIDKLAGTGLDALANGLKQLKPDNPTQALVIGALGEYVDRYGLEGFTLLRDLLLRAASGDDVELDLSDLGAASNLLAVLQQRESGERKAVLDALAKASDVLGMIAGVLVKAALASVATS